MKRILMVVLMALTVMAIPAMAHGNMDHVLGTVSKIAGNVVTVEKDGVQTEVVLTATTSWETGGKPGKQSELKVGDRVVIHAMKRGGKETAHEVRYAHGGK